MTVAFDLVLLHTFCQGYNLGFMAKFRLANYLNSIPPVIIRNLLNGSNLPNIIRKIL